MRSQVNRQPGWSSGKFRVQNAFFPPKLSFARWRAPALLLGRLQSYHKGSKGVVTPPSELPVYCTTKSSSDGSCFIMSKPDRIKRLQIRSLDGFVPTLYWLTVSSSKLYLEIPLSPPLWVLLLLEPPSRPLWLEVSDLNKSCFSIHPAFLFALSAWKCFFHGR